jgi:hypothetical protein
LGVTNQESVNAARTEIGKNRVLDPHQYAGINGIAFNEIRLMHTATGTDVSVYKQVYEVNVYGVQSYQAFWT